MTRVASCALAPSPPSRAPFAIGSRNHLDNAFTELGMDNGTTTVRLDPGSSWTSPWGIRA
jgi:hypothetical protein